MPAWLEHLRLDFALGVRTQRKAPAATAAVVATLALGIAATSLSFTVTNTLFLSPLPVADPAHLVRIYGDYWSVGVQHFTMSHPDIVDIRRERGVFAGVLAEQPVPYLLGAGDGRERVWGELVSGGYFGVLGLAPAAGRLFSVDEERTRGGAPVVVLSERLWRRRFRATPDITGATILLNGHPVRVVGVAPAHFHGTTPGLLPDVWVPAVVGDQLYPVADNWLDNRGVRSFFVTARLRPGVTVPQARAAIDALARRLREAYPLTNRGVRFSVMGEAESRVHPMFARQLLGASTISVAIALLVLLTACANVAGVLLVRASARRAEIGVRLALGATRARLVRQLLTEHAVTSIAAGLVGLAVAWLLTPALDAIRIPLSLPLGMEFAVDQRVLAFGFALTVATGILFGVAPAWAGAQADPVALVRDGGVAEAPRQSRTRAAFVAAQVALSILLLVGGGLFLRSLRRAQRIDIGFRPDGVVMTSSDLGLQGYTVPRARAFWPHLAERVRALPGVQSASLVNPVPFQLSVTVARLAPEGYTLPADGSRPGIESAVADPAYFATMRIPLIEGREFTDRDTLGAPSVLVLNDVAARLFWPDGHAVGHRMTDETGKTFEVVGVARRGKYLTLGEDPRPYVYFPLRQTGTRAATVVARAACPPKEGQCDLKALLRAIGESVHALDPDVPLYDVKTLPEHVAIALAPAKVGAGALALIGLVALLLTSLGLYGTVAQVVNRRTYEIGIRRALGARDADVARLVVRDATALVVAGIAVGGVLSLAAARLLRSLLYVAQTFDPVVVGGAVVVLLLVCIGAAWLPTRRAIRVEAAAALRYQ